MRVYSAPSFSNHHISCHSPRDSQEKRQQGECREQNNVALHPSRVCGRCRALRARFAAHLPLNRLIQRSYRSPHAARGVRRKCADKDRDNARFFTVRAAPAGDSVSLAGRPDVTAPVYHVSTAKRKPTMCRFQFSLESGLLVISAQPFGWGYVHRP